MKVPIAWLRDYLDLSLSLSTSDIAERYASLGFPSGDVIRRPQLSGVVVGRLTRVEKHPNADKLQVCTIDVAGARPLTIATAATNVATGNVVPVATIGAQLAGMSIGPRKMRGIDSEGMLCSADELGLPAEWFEDGILQLETTLEPGTDFVTAFRLNDDVLDLEVTANRVDALSVLGLARELAASLGTAVREPALGAPALPAVASDTFVTLESPDCKRFVAQRVSNVRVGIAPFWMRARLALAGLRPIDSIVDISNFVMLETAQPLHFYDYERLGGGRLIVRDARANEPIRTLDDIDRALDSRFLVIADEREPQCIAGLRGAAPSEITAATRELVIEAATFAGPRIRRMSVALGVRTEASTRHEKGLALGLSTLGAARAAHLLAAGGASPGPAVAYGSNDASPAAIAVTVPHFAALLGMPIAAGDAAGALDRLGFSVAVDGAGGRLAATPPAWRSDVRIAEDVIEEVARVVGYDKIEATLPAVFESGASSAHYRAERRVAHALAARGYREAYTFSLQPASVARIVEDGGIALPAPVVEIENPLSEEQRYLRFSLLPALLELAAKHAGRVPYRAFEIGRIFFGGHELFEVAGACWLAALPEIDEPAWRDSGFLSFKADASALVRALTGMEPETVTTTRPNWHPGKTASLLIDGTDVATIGAVDPRLVAAYDIAARVYAGWMPLDDLPAYRAPRYRAPSRYPAIERDLALIVAPEMPAKDIEHAVRAAAGGMLAGVRVFDEYRGPQVADGKKSLAVRITLQRSDATLSDAEAEARVAAILASLAERCGATLRA